MRRYVQFAVGAILLFAAYGLKPGISSAADPAPVPAMQDQKPQNSAAEVVVYASDLPKSALAEFEVWKDSASPGGTMVGVANGGADLDPPPEDDPHVTFKVKVQSGVLYRCWIHMKVGTAKGTSQANKVWVQLAEAVDKSGKKFLTPASNSYLTAQGPKQPGWVWVQAVLENGKSPAESTFRFGVSGEITVRIQAGMEGVGFDQFLLSPARFLENAPAEAVVSKS